ncbi:ATP-grasp fold amidoligase family protein [Clostridium sp. 3-3]|uniref:ATP-grasp fold amidoligase family protein n=1 Tax=Clostridium sp. 3-3 TaxID=2070757 RepID=UPI000CDA4D8C|nr:ATP-grasp fold amidoligase family protein [Clostridium sp. 3-3]POO85651.1 glycosyltransferase [Clostridium sp. 3-3]
MNNITKNLILSPFNLLYKLSPELDLKILFYLKQGYKLNLRNPKTYNEKLQWIKLYDKNPLMPQCCDKYAVRNFVKEQGCNDILNELYWEGFNPEDILFDKLPEKFVIKVTHGSTFNIICTNKNDINRLEIINKCKKWLKGEFLPCYGEWFYGIEKPRVIVEKFLESSDDLQLRDYKVFCFNGEPKIIRVDTDRFTDHKMDFFDINWNRIEDGNMGYPVSGRDLEKPPCLESMLEYAKKLSNPFYHARVDFYIVNNKVIFGEITFTNGAGFDKCSSYEFDKRLGDWLIIKNID